MDAEPSSNPSAEKPFVGEVSWTYSSTELWADGVIHALGILLVTAGAIALMFAVRDAVGAAAAAIYLGSLVLSFAASAAYNVWPVGHLKWMLRRLDQSAIYLLIAGTYTPFLAAAQAWSALGAIWLAALLGVGIRIWRPGRYDRLSIALYLLMGWSGVLLLDDVLPVLSATTLWLIVAGGVTFSVGVIFHVWRSLRFQNAIWHGFVLVAASIHYVAIWSTIA